MRIEPWKRIMLGALVLMMLMAGFLMGRDTTGAVASAVSTVAIVRSERPSAYEITADEIRDLVRRAVALAGGLADVVKPGDTVVLKPNLVEMRDFIGRRSLLPELMSGVATDRRVVAAVAELVHEAGAAEILVMEGSAIPTGLTFAHYGYIKENLPYVNAIIPLEEDSGEWREFDSPKLAEVRLPDGKYQKAYYLNRRYYEADVVISLPTLKNHWDAAVTGAVKNLAIGATPANIYRNEAGDLWRSRIPHDGDRYHSFMRDFYKCKPARFAVMDGLVGIQGWVRPA